MPIGKRDDIVIRYGADDSRFQKVTKRVKGSAANLSSGFGKLGQAIGSVFSRGAVGAVGAISSAFAFATKSALEFADSIAKIASKVGVGIESLQELRYAAEANGVSQNTLDMALQRFSRRVGEAAQGTGVLYKELVALNIPLRDAHGNMRSNEAILADYADAVQHAESAQEQLRLSFVAFDSEGAALVNLMRQGSEGMASAAAHARELGLVLDENTVKSSEALNQAWDDFTTRVSVGFKKAVLGVAKVLDNLAGNYRTLEDVNIRLNDAVIELAENEERLASRSGLQARAIKTRIAALREEIESLYKKGDALKRLADLDAELAAGGSTPAARDTGPSRKKGSKGAPAEPELSYHEQNLKDYKDYRAGRIDRAEWLKRERERNPFINQESPYRDEFGLGDPNKKPSKTASSVSRGGGEYDLTNATKIIASSVGDEIKLIASGIVEELDKQLDAAIGKERVAPVRAELINADAAGAPSPLEEAATQEGTRSGHEHTGGGLE